MWGWILIVVAGFGAYLSVTSDFGKERSARAEAEQKARETPHVVREADGCKVYAFERGGRDHYFTRCNSGQVETTTT